MTAQGAQVDIVRPAARLGSRFSISVRVCFVGFSMILLNWMFSTAGRSFDRLEFVLVLPDTSHRDPESIIELEITLAAFD